MYLSRLDLHHFRNFETLSLDLPPGIILITGANGSGKTSILEAAAMLGSGRSFRSNRGAPVIRYGAASLTVFGELVREDGRRTALGITKERSGSAGIRIDGEQVRSAADLAAALPVQLINPESVELVTGSPARRRRFLDWGTFHVEPSFMTAWRGFRRSLDQRNALLRSGVRDPAQFVLWERHLAECASAIDRCRTGFVEALLPEVKRALDELGDSGEVSMQYVRGWDAACDYTEVLADQRESDRESGFTRAGPQRADLRLVVHGRRAADVLSRGQQKILACALLIAQARDLEQRTDKSGLYLVDDLPSELDGEHRRRLGNALAGMRGQVMITSVQEELVTDGLDEARELTRFHVEHDQARPVPLNRH